MDEKLKEIEARCEKATPGPWKFEWPDVTDNGHYETPKVFSIADPDNPRYLLEVATGCNEEENGCFLASARTDIPYLLTALRESAEREEKLVEAQRWIPVSERLPECDTTPNSFGVPVLVWPPFKSDGCSDMTQAFYGCRQTDEPNFYIFGRVFDPEYWMPLPAPPAKEESHD